jgi:hypothetical protein
MTTSTGIANVLGGKQTLRTEPRTAADWQAVVSKGVPIASAEALKRRIDIGDDVLARLRPGACR